jgi:hypothetical protein
MVIGVRPELPIIGLSGLEETRQDFSVVAF